MNLLILFQVSTAQILDNKKLSENQQEKKIIQICDLCRFVNLQKKN